MHCGVVFFHFSVGLVKEACCVKRREILPKYFDYTYPTWIIFGEHYEDKSQALAYMNTKIQLDQIPLKSMNVI